MKNLILLLILSFGLAAQPVRVNSFPRKVVFHGNSLFHLSQGNVFYGFGVSKLTRPTLTVNVVVEDYSYQGKTTAQLASEFPTMVAPFVHPGDVIVFWEFRNSMANNIGNLTDAQALQAGKDYAALVHSYGLKIIGLSVIPTNTLYLDDSKRLSFNTLLAADNSWLDGYIDITTETIFDDVLDLSNTTYFETDLIHLKTAAQTVVQGRLTPIIHQVLAQ